MSNQNMDGVASEKCKSERYGNMQFKLDAKDRFVSQSNQYSDSHSQSIGRVSKSKNKPR